MTHEPWTDERLAAAFADRYDRPIPREVTIATLERVRATARRPRWWPTIDRRRVLSLASGVAVVAILAILVTSRGPTVPGASAVPSAVPSSPVGRAQNTPYPSLPPSPAVAGFAATAAGLQVRPVTDAATFLADPDLGDTELAFAGWYSASDRILRCAVRLVPVSPIEQPCGLLAWLSSTNTPLFGSDGYPVPRPYGGDTMIEVRFVAPVAPVAGDGGPHRAMVTTPRPVILIGHFNDERAVRCSTPTTCERTFVVDGVANSGGELSDPAASSAFGVAASRLNTDQATVLARDWVGSAGEILSVGLVRGSDAPWFDDAAKPDCLCRPTWFVRGYRTLPAGTSDRRAAGTPVAGWLTIDDATSSVKGTLDHGGESVPPPPSGSPATVEGLPVRTVVDAIGPDRLLFPAEAPYAVAGWLTQMPLHPCPWPSDATCERDTVILDGTAERLINVDSDGSATTFQAKGPILYPATLPGSPPLPTPNRDGSPHRVILVMHRGDLRSDSQGPADPVAPTDFVIDQIAWLDGVDQPPSMWIEPGIQPTRSAANVLSIAGPIQTGRTWTISVSAVSSAHLRAIGSLTSEAKGIVWLIRLTGADPSDPSNGPDGWGTILVDDTTSATLESTWASR